MNIEPIMPVTDNDEILKLAQEEARKWESPLGSGKKGRAEEAFEALANGIIEMGDPQAYTHQLTPETFQSSGLMLSPSIEDSMKGKRGYAYYFVSFPTLLYPAKGAQYRLLESQLSFKTKKKDRQPAIYNMFPKQEWRPVLDFGGSLHLALDTGLQWGVEVEGLEEINIGNMSGELSGRVANTNGLHSFITIAPYKYTLGRMEIVAENSAQRAMWRLDSKESIRGNNGNFAILLKVPKEIKKINVHAAVQAEPSFNWLIAQVEHIVDHLSKTIKDILRWQKGFPLQYFQTWELDLKQ